MPRLAPRQHQCASLIVGSVGAELRCRCAIAGRIRRKASAVYHWSSPSPRVSMRSASCSMADSDEGFRVVTGATPRPTPFASACPSARPPVRPSVRLPACLPVCLSVCLFLCAFGVSLSLRAKRAGCVCARAADPQPPGRLGVLGQKLRATYPWSSPNPWVTSRESCLLGSLPVASGEEVEPAVDPVTGCEVDNLACEPVYFATAWLSSCVASAEPDYLPTCLDMHRPRGEQDEQSV